MQSETDIGPYDDMLTTVEETQVKVVWAGIKIIGACQDNFTRNSARREMTGETKGALGELNNVSE